MTPFSPRYAIYYVPERDSSLERLGASLLGRDIHTGAFLPQPALGGISGEDLFSLSRDARRYGLHATLKPPFFLKPGVTEDELARAAERFASARGPLPLPALAVDRIGSFYALTMHPRNEAEIEEAERIRLMAGEAVSFFDRFRAPPSEEELARRKQKGLTPRQERYLFRWGYPYVFDEYRFHITLMDAPRQPEADAQARTELQRCMAHTLADNWVKSIVICRSDSEGDFTVLHRSAFRTEFFPLSSVRLSAFP